MNHEDTPQIDDNISEHHVNDILSDHQTEIHPQESHQETHQESPEKGKSHQEQKRIPDDHRQDKLSQDKLSPRLQELVATIKTQVDSERKLETVIAFMEHVLTQTGATHFKEFWDARKICLDLFKENINPTSRVTFWAKYSELCRLARQLKDILNEQSAFAAEQIEIAVASIEGEINHLTELLEKMPSVDFGVNCHTIAEHYNEYNSCQRELNLLNTYAIRTNALRKELMKTDMRVRQKNQFFERLSKLGDTIFPRRKLLIQEVSSLFINDVAHFIEIAFSHEVKTTALFDLREEIKALQSIAKVLTLNTEAFSTTRKQLSECWDSIKNVVKERRKVVSEQKVANKQHRDHFAGQLEALKSSAQSGTITTAEGNAKLEEIIKEMRATSLGRQEIRELREMVQELQEVFSSQGRLQEAAKQFEAKQREQEANARFEQIKEKLQAFVNQAADLALDLFILESERLSKEIVEARLNRAQKQQIEKFERQVRDLIEEKRDQQLLQLSDDDREAINQLKTVLKERKERRQEIRNNITEWRKASGGSGLDFTQAIRYNELIEAEKDRLEKIESGIYEIEKEISRLQRQVKSDAKDA